ncbi:MAG TPA: UvrD-helicase domain-containing protein [Firmicutes bacterium]|nr:UvrD-helicase domain-containing protein [Bacillota bacterium]
MMEEIQWVIEGRRLRSLDQYLQADRIGREVPFGEGLRRLVWAVYEKTQDFLGENGRSWEYYRGLALDILQEKGIAVKKYDVVIVDEAQDLSPAALALCAELCACPQGLFFTADANQSIYNRGFAWSRVHNALNFRGRSTILRCNYRSTRQIAQACFDCLAADGTDRETIEAKAVRTGPRPQLHRCNSTQEQYQSIARFLEESAAQLRLPVWTGTVLTPANRLAGDIAEALRAWAIPAKHVSGDELHLKERVVKVMTIHAAKGLEFPTVALAHLEERYFPGLPEGLKSEAEMREFTAGRQKLLFVGCSRAMRRLALFGNEAYFSPLAERLDPGLWELRGI